MRNQIGPNHEWADRIKNVSSVAWQHINFYGRFEFGKQSNPIDMAQMVQELAKRKSHMIYNSPATVSPINAKRFKEPSMPQAILSG